MKKKKTALLLTLVLGFSLCFPSSVFAKNNKVKELKPAQEQIQQTMKKELKKKAKTKKPKQQSQMPLTKGRLVHISFRTWNPLWSICFVVGIIIIIAIIQKKFHKD
ncbi:MAG: hypothetical protein PHD70_04520 [Anaerostipes sp.]|nr:hypothetical protein [Anaerostipes sp.]